MRRFFVLVFVILVGTILLAEAPEFTYLPPQQVVYWTPPAEFGEAAKTWTPPPEVKWTAQPWAPPPGFVAPEKAWEPPEEFKSPEIWTPPSEFGKPSKARP